MPQLMSYPDYRDFLRERLAYDKERNPNLSLHYFARKLKLSASFLSMLLTKQKHISLETLSDLADFLGLESLDRHFLVYSVLELTSKSDSQTHFFRQMRQQMEGLKLVRLEIPKHKANELGSLVRSELYMILNGLVTCPDFQESPEWIMPRLLARDESPEMVMAAVREILEIREKMGVKGSDLLASSVFSNSSEGTSVFRSGTALVERALDNPDDMFPYYLLSHTYTFSRAGLLATIAELGEFLKGLSARAMAEKAADHVVVFGGGLVTVAKPPVPKVKES